MIDTLKPYPVAYKDSGLPWLGRVPAHWASGPGFGAFREKQIKNLGLREKRVLSLSYGRIVVKPEEKLRGLVPDSFETYQIVDPGDIIIRSTDLQNDKTSLRVGYVRDRGIITSAYICLQPTTDVLPEFGYQLLNTYDLSKVFYGMGSGLRQNLEWSDFKRMPVFLPPSEEQAAIVRYLDHATRKIDQAIRAKRKIIALLNEQKQAIIHRAVTRGLDLNVPLKDSGIQWLGQIPAHWEALQIRRLISFVTSGSRGWAEHYSDDGYIFIQSGNLGRSMALNLSFVQHVTPPAGAEGERTRVRLNDVLICITGALTGNVVVVDTDLPAQAFVNQHVALLRVRQQMVVPRFLAFVLHSKIGNVQFKMNEYGGTKQGLGFGDVKSVFVPVPPVETQTAICKALDEQLGEIFNAIAHIEREISLLREYRTRLIADVVTGKLDVRAAAARLPEPEAEEAPETVEVENDEEALEEAS